LADFIISACIRQSHQLSGLPVLPVALAGEISVSHTKGENMGHCIQAIVYKSGSIGGRGKAYSEVAHIHLEQGFMLLLQHECLLNELEVAYSEKPTHLGGNKPSLPMLYAPFAALACDFSASSKIGYLETDYFGGMGTQSAIMWEKGKVVYGPKTHTIDSTFPSPTKEDLASNPINTLLQNLGAKRSGCIDEFEGVGLDRIRSMDG